MRLSSTDTSLNLATGLSSIGMFVVGLIKSVDWVLIGSITIPIIVAIINVVVKIKEVKTQTIIQQREQEELEHERRMNEKEEAFLDEKHAQDLELARINAARKVELEADVSYRMVEVQKEKTQTLKALLSEVQSVSEEEKKYLLNKLLEQVDNNL